MNHPFTRLVARYGPDQGLYLYGELCLLQTLGIDAFRSRHTPGQLVALAAQLGPLSLWPDGIGDGGPPSEGPDDDQPDDHGPDRLAAVAQDLAGDALRLACGVDLFHAICAWAAAGQVDPGAWFDPSRAALTESLGFIPPPLTVWLEPSLPAHGYRLLVWREAVIEGEAHPGLDLILAHPEEAPPGLPYPWSADPTGPGWVAWMPVGPASDPPLDLARVHWLVAIDRHLTASLPAKADRLLTTGIVQALLSEAERSGYDHELERYVSVPELQLVFKHLLRDGLPLKPIAPILESMLRTILAELAGRPIPASELERLQRQLPVFPTRKLSGIVRASMGLPAEATPGASKLARLSKAAPLGPTCAAPSTDPDERSTWRLLAAEAAARRPAAAKLAAALRRADVLRGHSAWTAFHFAAPPPTPGAANDPRLEAIAARLAATRQDYLDGWEAWKGFGRASDAVRRACAALDGHGLWPAGLDEPGRPDWRWLLGRPEALLAGLDAGEVVEAT